MENSTGSSPLLTTGGMSVGSSCVDVVDSVGYGSGKAVDKNGVIGTFEAPSGIGAI